MWAPVRYLTDVFSSPSKAAVFDCRRCDSWKVFEGNEVDVQVSRNGWQSANRKGW